MFLGVTIKDNCYYRSLKSKIPIVSIGRQSVSNFINKAPRKYLEQGSNADSTTLVF